MIQFDEHIFQSGWFNQVAGFANMSPVKGLETSPKNGGLKWWVVSTFCSDVIRRIRSSMDQPKSTTLQFYLNLYFFWLQILSETCLTQAQIWEVKYWTSWRLQFTRLFFSSLQPTKDKHVEIYVCSPKNKTGCCKTPNGSFPWRYMLSSDVWPHRWFFLTHYLYKP